MMLQRNSMLHHLILLLLILLIIGKGTAQSESGTAGPYNGLVVLYGDPHVHTMLSDGDETPDFALRYARDVAGLDWCVVTDHTEDLTTRSAQLMSYYRSLPERYNDPGNFVVLFGYEWTSNLYGHRNVYTTNNSIPVISKDDPMTDDPWKLWDALAEYDVITVPHHPMIWSEAWWAQNMPGVETCVEFYSKWGMSLDDNDERPLTDPKSENSVFRAMTQEGRRYGLMAGSDTHLTRPGARIGETRGGSILPYSHPGITGVWATEHTSEALFEALQNRHCYGMTGTRINVMFSVNGAIMGSEVETSGPPEIEFSMSSEEIIERVEILTIDSFEVIPIQTYYPESMEFSGSFVDLAFNEDIAYTMKVYLANTDLAMVSPVWVTAP